MVFIGILDNFYISNDDESLIDSGGDESLIDSSDDESLIDSGGDGLLQLIRGK